MLAPVLIVDDDAELLDAVNETLRDLGYDTVAQGSAENALRALSTRDFEVVLTDLRMPGQDGITLCERVAENWPQVRVIVMTAYGNVDSAVDAMRAGAFDFITKPFGAADLAAAVERALNVDRPSPVTRLTIPPDAAAWVPQLVGGSPPMRQLRERIAQLAPSSSTVLITGETGTGKELVARALHEHGKRRLGPFVAINCAAIPGELLESELFGYSKGAFTGAATSRRGLLHEADGGTLLLDEISAMPLDLQAKMLRVLQERTARPVGSGQEEAFDARVVAATNRDLRTAVREGTFREDLLYRLSVLVLHLPPLRERGDDVIELAHHFLARQAAQLGIDSWELLPDAELRLKRHGWPGNVRELENCMQAAAALAEGGRIGFEELPTGVRKPRAAVASLRIDAESLEHVERLHIERVLDAVDWNKAEAARTLGIDRATLYRKLTRLGLERPRA